MAMWNVECGVKLTTHCVLRCVQSAYVHHSLNALLINEHFCHIQVCL